MQIVSFVKVHEVGEETNNRLLYIPRLNASSLSLINTVKNKNKKRKKVVKRMILLYFHVYRKKGKKITRHEHTDRSMSALFSVSKDSRCYEK